MLLEILTSLKNEKTKILDSFKQMIQQIDKGILLGAPLPHHPSLLTEVASNLNQHFSSK